MCTVSFVGDNWQKGFEKRPYYQPEQTNFNLSNISREEFDELKKEVTALKELLIAAKNFDEATGQPDCEVDEKVALIKAVAKAVGVDLEDILDSGQNDH